MNRTIWARDFECDAWAPMACYAGGGASAGSSSGKQQAQQAPVENPAFPLLQSNVESARNVAAQPFQAYGGQLTAGMTPTQQYAGNLLMGAPGVGNGAINQGLAATQNATGDLMSGIRKYQSPYTNDVVNATQADIERQRQMAINQGGANATMAHAFGGARQGVADSLTNEAALRTSAQSSAQLRDQGFQTAAGLAGNDANRNLQAGSTFGQLGNAQAGNYLNASNAINQYGSQEQQTQQAGLTAQLNEFMRAQNYPVEMQRLISEAMGLVPGGVSNAGTSSGKQSSFNAAANAWI